MALCREPTEPAGETRGWAAPNSPNRRRDQGAQQIPRRRIYRSRCCEGGSSGTGTAGPGRRCCQRLWGPCRGGAMPWPASSTRPGGSTPSCESRRAGRTPPPWAPPRGSFAAPTALLHRGAGHPVQVHLPGGHLPGGVQQVLGPKPCPQRARSSREQAESFSGPGKLCQPVSPMGSPSSWHNRSMIPLIRGMWLFWEMRKEHRPPRGPGGGCGSPGRRRRPGPGPGSFPTGPGAFPRSPFPGRSSRSKNPPALPGNRTGPVSPPGPPAAGTGLLRRLPTPGPGVRRPPAEGLAAVQCLARWKHLGMAVVSPKMGRFHRLSPSCIKIHQRKCTKKGRFPPHPWEGPGPFLVLPLIIA